MYTGCMRKREGTQAKWEREMVHRLSEKERGYTDCHTVSLSESQWNTSFCSTLIGILSQLAVFIIRGRVTLPTRPGHDDERSNEMRSCDVWGKGILEKLHLPRCILDKKLLAISHFPQKTPGRQNNQSYSCASNNCDWKRHSVLKSVTPSSS